MSSRNGPMKMTSPRGTHQIESRVVPIVAMDKNENKESSLDIATRQTEHLPPQLLSVAALLVQLLMSGNKLFPIAMSCPSMPVPSKPCCTITTTLSNSISVGPRPLHPLCRVPNSAAAPTTQPRQRMPQVMSWPLWKPCHPHRINGWSCWNTSRPRRLCGRMVLLVGVEMAKFVCLLLVYRGIARPSVARLSH